MHLGLVQNPPTVIWPQVLHLLRLDDFWLDPFFSCFLIDSRGPDIEPHAATLAWCTTTW